MMDKLSTKEFCQKVESEGTNIIGILEYGLRDDDLDDSNPRFKEIIRKMSDLYIELEQLQGDAEEMSGYDWQ